MKLSELFSYLTYGELNNLKVGGKDDGGIFPKYSDEVVSFIEQGLTALHTRFALKHSELILQQFEHVTNYILREQYAENAANSTEPYRWIQDTPENPFKGGILRVDEMYNEIGEEIILNNENWECAVYTPQYDILQMPYPSDENAYSVIYRSDHAKIELSAKAPKEIEIEVPNSIIKPLVLYVASLAHTAVGSPEGMSTGFAKMQEYEAACITLELQGAVHKEEWINERVWRNGWV